jgi:ribosomal protein L37AE/L43A
VTPPVEPVRTKCPDCGSKDLSLPDEDGWQSCRACGSDFAPDYQPGDDG